MRGKKEMEKSPVEREFSGSQQKAGRLKEKHVYQLL